MTVTCTLVTSGTASMGRRCRATTAATATMPLATSTTPRRRTANAINPASPLTGAPSRCTVSRTVDPLALRAGRSRSLADARSTQELALEQERAVGHDRFALGEALADLDQLAARGAELYGARVVHALA